MVGTDVHPQTSGPLPRERSIERQRELGRYHVRTDGGTSATTDPRDRAEERDDGSEQSRFQSLFLEITGTEKLVERQHYDGSSRVLDEDGGTGGVSDYLTDIARDDGLSETRSNPDPDR